MGSEYALVDLLSFFGSEGSIPSVDVVAVDFGCCGNFKPVGFSRVRVAGLRPLDLQVFST